MIKETKKSKKFGFTLVETLVSIAILSLAVLSSFTAVQGSLQSSSTAKEQIIAFYLTQEAMEFIKNIRDENALNSINGASNTWLTNLSAVAGDPCYFGKTCKIDSGLKLVTACSGGFGSCSNLNEDTTTGLFGYTSGWPTTIFKREIQFTNISADEVLVTIKISWTSRNVAKFFQISQILLNHQ